MGQARKLKKTNCIHVIIKMERNGIQTLNFWSFCPLTLYGNFVQTKQRHCKHHTILLHAAICSKALHELIGENYKALLVV